MITELSVQNFKSWQDTGRLQLAPLTGLFGANNSGKTSILQVLLMLKQTVEPPPGWKGTLNFGDEESLVNLGSFDDIIHRPANNSSLTIFVSWKLPENLTTQNRSQVNPNSFLLSILGDRLEGFRYGAGGHFFETGTFARADYDEGSYPVLISYSGKASSQSPFRCYGIRGASTKTQEIFCDLEEAFENLFSHILYLGPLREHPRPVTYGRATIQKGLVGMGNRQLLALLSQRVQLLPIEEQIPKWLQRLGLIDSYRVNPISDTKQDYEFLVKQYKGGPEVRLTDVGFGVSQVLPVLILCYSAPEGSILILEQPEAHLHPSAQSELGDVLVDVVKNRNVQIILESHSEHLLLRLMRRIAEEEISATDTTLYFCQINDGTSEIERLDVNEYGNIRNWPQDFFGDSTGELIKKTKAEMQRRKVMR